MSAWTDAIVSERLEKAKKLYESYASANPSHLSAYETGVKDVLGWMSLESDEAPEPFEY